MDHLHYAGVDLYITAVLWLQYLSEVDTWITDIMLGLTIGNCCTC